MKNNYMISVAMCTYNGEKYICEQLDSIIKQTVSIDEIIICDDCSNDNTIGVAKSKLEGTGIVNRIIRNKERLGVTRNFEKAIKHCKGDIIFTSDQDDLWEMDKVEKLLIKFQNNPKCVLAFSDASVIDGEGKRILPSLLQKDGFLQKGYSPEIIVDEIVRLNYTVYGCTMAFRRDFVQKIIPFVESNANHDAWIMCCAGLYGDVEYVPEKLIAYRIHGANEVGSLSGNKKWESIVQNEDSYQKFFAFHKLRSLRIMLIEEALKLKPGEKGVYADACRKMCCWFERLGKMRDKNIICILFLMILSFIDGSYFYRFCDRGRKIDKLLMAKQLPHDVLFLSKLRRTRDE